jgi:hypothetical protein
MLKSFSALFVLSFCLSTLFAQPENSPNNKQGDFSLSIGGGLQGFNNLLAYKNTLSIGYVYTDTGNATKYERTTADAFFGGYIFFDAAYVEIDIGIAGSAVNGSQTIKFSIGAKL